jgi:hypothetical protein
MEYDIVAVRQIGRGMIVNASFAVRRNTSPSSMLLWALRAGLRAH